MKLTYLGFYVSDDLFNFVSREDVNNSVQTQRFATKFLMALSKYYNTYNFSCPSIVEFPKSKILITKFDCFEGFCDKNIVFPIINIFIIKQIMQFVCSLYLVVRNPTDHYICHGLNLPYMLTLVSIKLLFGSSICVLVTDPPVSKSKADGLMKRYFRVAYIYLVGVLVNKFDSMIALSPEFRESFGFEGRFLFIEGVC